MELVTGATGYVGGRLIERLVRESRPVRALAREPARLAPVAGVDAVRADLVAGSGLDAALDGVETAYYLVHSMEAAPPPRPPATASPGSTAPRPRTSPAPRGGPASSESSTWAASCPPAPAPSRRTSHRGWRSSASCSRARRGRRPCARRSSSAPARARSASWCASSSACACSPSLPGATTGPSRSTSATPSSTWPGRPGVAQAAGQSLDIVGADVLSYGEMIEQIADEMGVGRTPLRLGRAPDADRQRRGGRDRRAARRARPSADAEPRDRPPPA